MDLKSLFLLGEQFDCKRPFWASKEVEEALQIRCSLVLHPVERQEKVHYICSDNTVDKLLPLQEKNNARLISLDIGSVCFHDNEQTC
jgi:hypothetical protein